MAIKDILEDKKKLKALTEAAFKAIDADNNGYLEKHELEAILNNVASEMN